MMSFGSNKGRSETSEAVNVVESMTKLVYDWIVERGGSVNGTPGIYRIAFSDRGRNKVVEVQGSGIISFGKNGFAFLSNGK